MTGRRYQTTGAFLINCHSCINVAINYQQFYNCSFATRGEASTILWFHLFMKLVYGAPYFLTKVKDRKVYWPKFYKWLKACCSQPVHSWITATRLLRVSGGKSNDGTSLHSCITVFLYANNTCPSEALQKVSHCICCVSLAAELVYNSGQITPQARCGVCGYVTADKEAQFAGASD